MCCAPAENALFSAFTKAGTEPAETIARLLRLFAYVAAHQGILF
jgi:hypothetical protein